jgi:hypothetical protein
MLTGNTMLFVPDVKINLTYCLSDPSIDTADVPVTAGLTRPLPAGITIDVLSIHSVPLLVINNPAAHWHVLFRYVAFAGHSIHWFAPLSLKDGSTVY